MKFAYALSDYDRSDYIFLGCPDESGSGSSRQGASAGPAAFRRVSSRERANNTGALMQEAEKVATTKIADIGDVEKIEVSSKIKDIVQQGKIPITIGGDHSITFEVLKGVNEIVHDFVLLYFDAHPDCVCSKRHYYGSVLCDASELSHIDIENSFLIGEREPEPEELVNLERVKINVVDVHDLYDRGTHDVIDEIKKKIGNKKVYISIDLDVVDVAFAPGVDVPCPGGPSSLTFLDMLHHLSELNVIGFDIMELSPPHDRDDMTAHLAVRCVLELLKNTS